MRYALLALLALVTLTPAWGAEPVYAYANRDSIGPSGGDLTVTYDAALTLVDLTKITVGGATKGIPSIKSGEPLTLVIPLSAVTASTTVSVLIGAGALGDTTATPVLTTKSKQIDLTVDAVPPTASITPSAARTKDAGSFIVSISSDVITDSTGLLTVTGATKGTVTRNGSLYTVPFTGAAADVVLTIAAGALKDRNDNTNPTAFTSTIVLDTAAPKLTASPADGTKVNTLSNISLTFDEDTTVDAGKLTLTGATKGALTGSGKNYALALTFPQQGGIVLTAAAGAFTDGLGNASAATTVTVTYDSKTPTYVDHSVKAYNSSAATVVVTYDDALLIDASKITCDGATYTPTLGAGGKSVRLALTGIFKDPVRITLATGAVYDEAGNIAASQVLTLPKDLVRPTVTNLTSSLTTTNVGTSTVTCFLKLSEDCTVDGTKITVDGTPAATISGLFGFKQDWSFTVDLASVSRTVTVGAGALTDNAGNTNTATASVTITYDSTAPALKLQTPLGSDLTADAKVIGSFLLLDTGADDLASIDTTKITLTNATLGTPSKANDITVTPKLYRWKLPLTVVVATNPVTIALASGLATDSAGNVSAVKSVLSFTLTSDSTPPTKKSHTPQAIPGTELLAKQNVSLAITWDEPLDATFKPADKFQVNGVPLAAADITISGPTLTLTLQDLGGPDATIVGLSPGAVRDLAGNLTTADVSFSLPYDTTSPKVDSVSAKAGSKTYGPGQNIDLLVQFSEAISVTKAADGTDASLALKIGAKTAKAQLLRDGSDQPITSTDKDTLTFRYLVVAGDATTHLDVTGSNALTGIIKDASGKTLAPYQDGDDATRTIPFGDANGLFAQNTVVIDSTAPAIVSVTSTNADTSGTVYRTDDTITIQVIWSEKITFAPGSLIPKLTLQLEGKTREATYAAVSQQTNAQGVIQSVMEFAYKVQSGDSTNDLNYVGTTSLVLAGIPVSDAAGNQAASTPALPDPTGSSSLGGSKNLVVSGKPIVRKVVADAANAAGLYTIDKVLVLFVEYSEPMTVTGTPRFTLDLGKGAANPQAVFTDNTADGKRLRFTYTIQAGHTSADLDYVSGGKLNLVTGERVVSTTSSIDGDLNLPDLTSSAGKANGLAANAAIVVDTTAPTIASVKAVTDGSYGVGKTVDITVTFSEPVTITGTPQFDLDLNNGGTAVRRQAIFNSQSTDKTTATFRYTVAGGDTSLDLNYPANAALVAATGATITLVDGAGNSAIPTLPTSTGAASLGALSSVTIIGGLPVVTKVSGTNGIYITNEQVAIQVTMSTPVTVTGKPLLRLNTTPARDAEFSSVSGTVLTFLYVVRDGDAVGGDLDYASTGALVLPTTTPATTIIDPATGNPANLALPIPGNLGSLGATSDVLMRTSGGTAPTISRVAGPNGTYTTGNPIEVSVTFSLPVRVKGTPRLLLNSRGSGATTPVAVYARGTGTGTLFFTYTVAGTDQATRLEYTSSTALTLDAEATITDGYTAATLTLPAPGSANALGGTSAIIINTNVPTDPGKPSPVDGNSAGGGCGTGGGIALLGSLALLARRQRRR